MNKFCITFLRKFNPANNFLPTFIKKTKNIKIILLL